MVGIAVAVGGDVGAVVGGSAAVVGAAEVGGRACAVCVNSAMTVSAAAVWIAFVSRVGATGDVGPQAYRRLVRAISVKPFLIIGSPFVCRKHDDI